MCGICGVIGGHPPGDEETNVRAMTRALAHRGPDDADVWMGDGATLGHRRLTIIDLSDGRQPLSNEDGDVWITYNGEIYNYRQLRDELERAGHQFRTATDTEVLVHLYEEEGEDCLRRLRGMFAFAIWDARRGKLFAARDRFGQKPFYYTLHDDRLIFASEIKGLLAHTDVRVEPEPAAIDYYLSLRFVPPPLTMFRGIHKLPAGHCLTFADGEIDVRSYWTWTFDPVPERDESEWIEELEVRIEDAVTSHMVSDVPVGAYLSGGMDSSLVTAMMAEHLDGPVQTFAIGSDQASFDETPYARQVAEACGTRHQERFVDMDLLGNIPELVRCLDEPSDPISACMYEASSLASENVKVVLGGDGGDELFAGFDRYAGFRWVDLYAKLPRWLREDVIRPMTGHLPESFAYKSWTQKARWLSEVGVPDTGGGRYARMTSFFRFGPEERAEAYGPRLRAGLTEAKAEEAIARPFDGAPAESNLNRMLYADSVTRLPEHTLMLTDRLSMAHGLETRAPLLDHELAEFCATMPPDLKIKRGTTKYAMREVSKDWLPEAILERPKQGFMFPVAYWLNEDTLPGITERLLEGPLVEGGWIRGEAIEKIAAEHLEKRVDNHVRIWMLLNLDAWFRIYVAGEGVRSSPNADATADSSDPRSVLAGG